MLLRWIKRYKRALENVCCEEVLDSGIHSHIDYKEQLRKVQGVVLSLWGDNSPEFNLLKQMELDGLVGIDRYTPSLHENGPKDRESENGIEAIIERLAKPPNYIIKEGRDEEEIPPPDDYMMGSSECGFARRCPQPIFWGGRCKKHQYDEME